MEEEGSFIIKHKIKQHSEFPSCIGDAVALEETVPLLASQPQAKQEQCNENLPSLRSFFRPRNADAGTVGLGGH